MKTIVRAHEVMGLLDALPAGVTTLSLDCFDTLLWRAVQSPTDVFTGISLPGGGLKPRMMAEMKARQKARNGGTSETTLAAIYRELLPDADEAEIDAAIAHELDLEAAVCFGFPPVMELMRQAKARGLRLIIVSDMYLTEAQLRALLGRTIGAETLALVDQVFMSSAHGRGKRETLFPHVLQTLGCRPDQMLHIGDNREADVERPAELGIHVAHFVQFDAATEQRLRQEANAALLIDPAIRIAHPVSQPHRSQVAMRQDDDPVHALGHDVIGSTLHTFVLWLKAELDAMAARIGKPVRPLFLMRDGHLPLLAFDRLFPEAGGRSIELSRIIAVRASLRNEAALDDYLGRSLGMQKVSHLRRQLMLSKDEILGFGCTGDDEKADQKRFAAALGEPHWRAAIVERSQRFGRKLAAHLGAADVQPGDAVMLVDIGYNGTVQNMVEPFLREEMGLTVAGRYLFLREIEQRLSDKKGLLDTRHYEWRLLDALARCVGFLELLWNNGQGSTIDLTPNGKPIREETDAKARQNGIRDRVQAAALAFVEQAGPAASAVSASDTADARRRLAAHSLARLFFMPSAEETRIFSSFNYDLNMGAGESMKLFDPAAAAAGLRREGVTYLTGARRMYVPAEIQPHGLPLNVTHLASLRYALDFEHRDFAVGGIQVPVILVGPNDQALAEFTAFPTSDGYYRMIVPVGAGKFTPALQLGQLCQWVQIDAAAYIRVKDVERLADKAPRQPATLIADGMALQAEGLYAAENHGVILALPPASDDDIFLDVCFRPVMWRSEAKAANVRVAA